MKYGSPLSLASVIGDPARSEILVLLMDGRSFPAGELASYCHVSHSTMSHHLKILVENGLLESNARGRHKYYRIANERVAELIETLGQADSRETIPDHPLRYCRSCYSHIAGFVAVELRKRMITLGLVQQDSEVYFLTDCGSESLKEMGFSNVPDAGIQGRACLDWTERVPHIAGPLGRYLLTESLAQKWIARSDVPRKLVVTFTGLEHPLFRMPRV